MTVQARALALRAAIDTFFGIGPLDDNAAATHPDREFTKKAAVDAIAVAFDSWEREEMGGLLLADTIGDPVDGGEEEFFSASSDTDNDNDEYDSTTAIADYLGVSSGSEGAFADTASTAAAAPATTAAVVVEEPVFYEECVIHGMTVSEEGFCVLLRGVVCDRYVRVLVTPSDPMSDGLDRDQVETSEAVTLLQLFQGFPVNISLPHISSHTSNTSSPPSTTPLLLTTKQPSQASTWSLTWPGTLCNRNFPRLENSLKIPIQKLL